MIDISFSCNIIYDQYDCTRLKGNTDIIKEKEEEDTEDVTISRAREIIEKYWNPLPKIVNCPALYNAIHLLTRRGSCRKMEAMSSVEKEAVAEDGDALASVEAKRACLPATSTGSDSTFIGQCVSGYALAYPLLLVKHKHIPQHPMLALSLFWLFLLISFLCCR